MKRFALWACTCLILVSVAHADKISLSNGSVIFGQVTAVAGGKITVKTDFAGDLALDSAKVTALECETKFNYADADGQKHRDTSLAGVDLATVKVTWLPTQEDPTVQRRTWSGEISVDLNGKTGNSEKCRLGAGIKTEMKGPDDKLLLYANIAKAKEDGVYNEDEIIGGADYEYRLAGTKNSLFAKFEAEKDKIANIDLRTQYSLGYGYYLIDREGISLRARAGLNYQKKEFRRPDDTDESFGAELGIHAEKTIDAWGKLVTDVTYDPSWDDIHDYRFLHETSLDIPMLVKVPMTLRLGVSNEYNSVVQAGSDRMDTTYFVKLVYRWK